MGSSKKLHFTAFLSGLSILLGALGLQPLQASFEQFYRAEGLYPSKRVKRDLNQDARVLPSGSSKILNLSAKDTLNTQELAKLKKNKYKEIDLGNTPLTEEIISLLSQQGELEELNLNAPFSCAVFRPSSYPLTSEALKKLANLKNLKVLTVAGQNIGEKEINGISTYFPLLQQLDLRKTVIEDANLLYINRLKNLQVLDIGDTKVTNEGLKSLDAASLSALKMLNLSSTLVDEKIISHLAFFPNLETLDLRYTKLNPNKLEDLQRLKKLKLLYLKAPAEGVRTELLTIHNPQLKVVVEPHKFSWNPMDALKPHVEIQDVKAKYR